MSGYLKVLLFMLCVGCAGILVNFLPVAANLEEGLGLRMLFAVRGPTDPPDEVLLVSLGRETAKQLNLPGEIDEWPRSLHAQIVERLHQAGARIIVFDLLFNEPQDDEHDRAFSQAIHKAQNVILAQAIVKEKVTVGLGPDNRIGTLNIEKVLVPIERLAEASIAQAPFPLPKIPIALHQFWIFKPGAGDIPTLPVVAFLAYARETYTDFIKILLALEPEEGFAIPYIKNQDYTLDQMAQSMEALRPVFKRHPNLADRMTAHLDILETSQMSVHKRDLVRSIIDQCDTTPSRYLNFYGPPGTIRTIPYYQLLKLASAKPAETGLKDKVVFIGLTESIWPLTKDGLHTVYSQPDGLDLSGVEIAATAFGNLLQHASIRRLSLQLQIVLFMAWGALMALVSARMSAGASVVALLAINGLYLATAHIQFKSYELWLPIVVPLFWQTPLAFFSAFLGKHRRVSQERRNIRDAFGYYLPNEVVDRLMRNVSTLHDGGKILYSTCLITDAARYTHVSETMAPGPLRDHMNAYYEAIFEPIKAKKGIILQVVGDQVLSVWVSPRPDIQQKQRACAAALGIVESVSRFNAQVGEDQLPTRIGLHAGYIMLGNIGAMDHYEYRPVGDIVNTASRLEGLNKYLGTRVLVSEEALDGVNGLLTRCLGQFVFIGKTNASTVFELLARQEHVSDDQLKANRRFEEGINAFRSQSWAAAMEAFNGVTNIIGPDGPSTFYTDLCATYQRQPPQEGWDGTIELKQK